MKLEKGKPNVFMPFAVTITVETQFERDCLVAFYGNITNGQISAAIKLNVPEFDQKIDSHEDIIYNIQKIYDIL